MRRVLSVQAARALFGTVPRVLTVAGILLAFALASVLTEPFVPWWVSTLVGVLLFAALLYMGSVWLDRDLIRGARRHSE